MQRHQIGVAGAFDQTRQQGFAHEGTGRRGRQKVRLVSHQQVRVVMQDGLHEGNHWLVGHFTEVADLQPHLPWHVGRQRPALRILHPASREATLPLQPIDAREARTQPLQQGNPVTGRQLQSTGRGHGAVVAPSICRRHGRERDIRQGKPEASGRPACHRSRPADTPIPDTPGANLYH
ncbi:hypothetical protein D3C73_1009780 [compost metagenome]